VSDTSLVFNLVARERVSEVLEQLKAKVATVGKGIAQAMTMPAGAGIVAAVGGIAAGAVSAGLAVRAFSAAAQPQLESVAEASTAAEKAEEAHEKATLKAAQAQKLAAQGGDAYEGALREAESAAKAARDADAELEQQLQGMPPATRETALAFAGLKSDYEDWSDSLSGTTMPVFTKGIEILRDLLPTLTPFVRAAADAIGGFLDDVAVGVKSAGFKQWAADMSAAAGPALSNFLTIIKNLGIGFAGLLQAFLPMSGQMTGGLAGMSAAFADWGANLRHTEGFAQFLEMARNGGGALVNLAGAAGNLLVALAPVLGTTALLANALARVINNTPTPVLTVLASTLLAVKVGMMAYRTGAALVTTANAVMASSTWAAIAGWTRMMLFGLRAYAQIAVAAVTSALRTSAAWAAAAARTTATWLVTVIRVAAVSVARFAMMGAAAMASALRIAASWVIAMGPIGWVIAIVVGLVALIIAKWDTVKKWTGKIWNWVVGKIAGAVSNVLKTVTFLGRLPGMVAGFFGRMKDAAVRKALSLVVWMRGLGGRVRSAVGSLGRVLVNAGRSVVTGLWNGIRSMGGWLKSQLISFAKNMIPGPIAKALGIGSPSKVMAQVVGRWIPPGVIAGAEETRPQLQRYMTRLVEPEAARPATPLTTGMAPLIGAQSGSGAVLVKFEMAGATDEFHRLMRKITRVKGRGNVQVAFGQ
jgi:hypothetical protein